MPFNLITDLSLDCEIDIHDRGLHYGDGLFETMLLHDGVIMYWNEHYERLNYSAKKISIECPEKSWFEQKLSDYYNLNQTLVIKIILNRGSCGRGLHIPQNQKPNIYILHYEYNLPYKYQSVKAIISSITLSKNKITAGLKHLGRLEYVLATHELGKHPDANESILLDDQNFLVEGIVHNLFFVQNNILYSPDLKYCGVDGIMRQMIFKKMNQDGKPVRISEFTVQDLFKSDECFMCNSVQGIRPLTKLDQTSFDIGPLTIELQNHFNGHTLK